MYLFPYSGGQEALPDFQNIQISREENSGFGSPAMPNLSPKSPELRAGRTKKSQQQHLASRDFYLRRHLSQVEKHDDSLIML